MMRKTPFPKSDAHWEHESRTSADPEEVNAHSGALFAARIHGCVYVATLGSRLGFSERKCRLLEKIEL